MTAPTPEMPEGLTAAIEKLKMRSYHDGTSGDLHDSVSTEKAEMDLCTAILAALRAEYLRGWNGGEAATEATDKERWAAALAQSVASFIGTIACPSCECEAKVLDGLIRCGCGGHIQNVWGDEAHCYWSGTMQDYLAEQFRQRQLREQQTYEAHTSALAQRERETLERCAGIASGQVKPVHALVSCIACDTAKHIASEIRVLSPAPEVGK